MTGYGEDAQWDGVTSILVALSLAGLLPMLWFRGCVPRFLRWASVVVVILAVIGLAPIIVFLLTVRSSG